MNDAAPCELTVLLSEATAKLQAKVPKVREALVDTSFTVEQKYERVREEVPGLQMVVVLKYLLASGSLLLPEFTDKPHPESFVHVLLGLRKALQICRV